MTDDHTPFSFLLKDIAQLGARTDASDAQARKLLAQLRELEARTAKQRAENARLRSEVRFLEFARRKVDPFP